MLVKDSNLLSYLGVFLTASIFILASFVGLSTVFGAASSSVTSQVIVSHSAPTVSNVVLNSGNAIVLTPNATTSFNISYTITDNNGCSQVVVSTSTAFRNGVSSTCAKPNPTTSNLNCYLYVTQTTSSCQNSVTLNETDTVAIYYFADSTGNNSSTFSSDHWAAYAAAADNTVTNNSSSATSSAVDVNVLTAINVTTSSINYGTLAASSTSGTQNATGTNAGNSSTSLQLYALSTLISGSNSIATGSQQYGTSSFSFGAGVALTASAVTVPGYTLTKPTSTTNVAQTTFWLLGIPNGTATGTYTGTNVFSPLFTQ